MKRKNLVAFIAAIFLSTQAKAGGDSVFQSSGVSMLTNGIAQVINSSVGSGLISLGQAKNASSECGCAGIPLIILGIQGLMQAGANGGSKGSAAGTMSNVNGYGDPFAISQFKLPAEYNKIVDQKTLDKIKTDLQSGALGVTYDAKNDKYTTKDGKTYSGSDFSSQESMMAAGLSADQVSSLMSTVAKLEKDAMAKVEKLGLNKQKAGGDFESAASGGFGSGPGNLEGEEAGGYGLGLGGNNTVEKIRVPAATVAGMTKDFKGVPVGVAQDNIFSMMKRRYQVKEKQDSFIGDASFNLNK